jgi:hypothetical protein
MYHQQRPYQGPAPLINDPLFENLPELIKPQLAAKTLGISIKTIYDWHYRGKTRNVPEDLFVKINRLLYIRKTALKRWINSQNQFVLREVI